MARLPRKPRPFAVCGCVVLVAQLLAAGAGAQSRDLLDQVRVVPLPGPASCYPGTAGADATLFLRADVQRIDCDVFGGRTPCLARREFPADGPNGRAISLEAAVVLRPSVSGDGVSVWFNGFGFSVCGMSTTDLASEGCLGRDAIGIDVHTVAVSPFGSPLALTRLDPDNQFEPGNAIFVVDSGSFALLELHTVQTPGPGGLLLQVESMDFTVDGRFIVADVFNPLSGLWEIVAVSRASGETLPLVPAVAGLALRNPALAQTSDDFITFDAQDPATGANTVFAANLLTGELSELASTGVLGYPGYTGDDTAVVFTDLDPATESQVSLERQGLAADRLTALGPRTRWLTDGGVGVIYRRGVFDGTLSQGAACSHVPEPGALALGSAALSILACLGRARRRPAG